MSNSSRRKEILTLCERAEAGALCLPEDVEKMSPEDVQKMVHELQVYQIKLEMQNEALLATQQELAESRDLYADLYDFAPVGYLTIRADLTIGNANLTAATLFGVERKRLEGATLSHFVGPKNQDTVHRYLHAVLEGANEKQTCELVLDGKDGAAVSVLLNTTCMSVAGSSDSILRCIISDITERKQVESALRKSEIRLSYLIEAIPDTVQFKDLEGRWQVANSPALRTFGLENTEWQGLSDMELAARVPAMSKVLKACVLDDEAVYKGGVPATMEEGVQLPDGSPRVLEVTKIPLQEADGGVSGLVVVGRDVTKRKQAEDAVRLLNATLQRQVVARTAALGQSEKRFRRIYEHSGIGIVIADRKGRILQCNQAYGRITGYSEEALCEMEFPDLIHFEDRAHHTALVERLQRREIESFEVENRYIHNSGRSIWLQKVISLLPELSGPESQHMVALVTDVSLRRQAQDELHRSELALAAYFLSAPIGLLWVDEKGRISRINRAQLEMFGVTRSEVLLHRIDEFDVDGELAKIQTALREGQAIRNHRAKIRLKDGSFVYVLIDATAILEEGRLLRMDWFIRDITRRVEMEREMLDVVERERQQMGRELHDDLGQVLHGLHFIAAELQARMHKNGLPEAREIERLAGFLEEALATTRSLAHGLQPVSELPEGLINALREHAARIQELYGVNCHFICPEPVEMADPKVATHLFRIAQEAVNNAIKHAKCGNVSIRLMVVNDGLLLGVSDDGHGRFDQADLSRGIGLRVMRFRAAAIEGSLVVQRRPGVGTEVVCSLPFPSSPLASSLNPPFTV
jgi:PAS domain S-box-containing protein